MRRQSRRPRVGDLIIETAHSGKKYIGIVHNINLDSYGHQRSVYIQWSDNPPPYYNKDHGYSGVNIHNLRMRYNVVRGGVRIP